MTLREFTEFFDFDYELENGKYKLIDLLKVNFGNIEDEIFDTAADVIQCFVDSIYYPDYIERDLEEEYGYNGDYTLEDEYNFFKENSISYVDILEMMMYPENIKES